MIAALRYYLARWWWKRQIAVCAYRREELHRIMRDELALIDFDEGRANAALRELQSRRLDQRMREVRT